MSRIIPTCDIVQMTDIRQRENIMTAEELIRKSEGQLSAQFALADEISEYNQEKVLKAFQKHNIAIRHFNPSTGYGYGD